MNLHLAQLDEQLQLLINSKQIEKSEIKKKCYFMFSISLKQALNIA